MSQVRLDLDLPAQLVLHVGLRQLALEQHLQIRIQQLVDSWCVETSCSQGM